MDLADNARVRVNSLLRRAGLSRMPRAVLAFAAAACLALCGLAVVRFWPGAQAPANEFALQQASSQMSSEAGAASFEAGAAESAQELKVDVEGCVRAPGLYALGAGARVGEAVDAAGGFTKKAARTSVNLAQKLEDGQQVYVPSKREVEKGSRANEAASASGAGGSGGAAAASGAVQAPASGGGADAGKVNLNTADAAQLQTLSGIGAALSQRIVEYREVNGGFAKVEDLMNVPGIGETRFAQIKDGVCV